MLFGQLNNSPPPRPHPVASVRVLELLVVERNKGRLVEDFDPPGVYFLRAELRHQGSHWYQPSGTLCGGSSSPPPRVKEVPVGS